MRTAKLEWYNAQGGMFSFLNQFSGYLEIPLHMLDNVGILAAGLN